MDVLIIKKPPDVKIEKNIGQIFKGHNIIEYKSPDDNLTPDDYNKVFGYAYLYAALHGIDTEDITLSFVQTARPRALLKRLQGRQGKEIGEASDGIYYVSGEPMTVQIIESKKLSEDENLWLKALSNGLNAMTMKRVLTKQRQLSNETNAYIYAILEANADIFEEVRKMAGESLAEVLDRMGYVERSYLDRELQAVRQEAAKMLQAARQEATKETANKLQAARQEAAKETVNKLQAARHEATKETAKEMAREMLKEGDSIEKIARVTKLSVDELNKILNLHE